MKNLPDLVDHILTKPNLSDRAIAVHVGCSKQTVRRYRRRVARLATTPSQLRQCNEPALKAVLLGRRGAPRRTESAPDFESLMGPRIEPNTSMKDLWRLYGKGHPNPLSCSQFTRRLKQYLDERRAKHTQGHPYGEPFDVGERANPSCPSEGCVRAPAVQGGDDA